MADNPSSTRRLVRRALGALASLVLVASLGQVAGAQTTEDKLEAAKARFEELKDEITAQQGELSRLGAEAARIAERLEQAQGRYEQITEQLRNTTLQLRQAQADYQGLQGQLESRVREAYITGPGSSLEFLLGATSLADLSARMEYVNALSATDADLATDVQNLKNELSAQQEEQQDLQEEQAKLVREREAENAAIQANLAQQQSILDDLQAKEAEARELVEDLTKQYKRELAALTGVRFYDGVFRVCPVDAPRALYDGFGAPRYGGGYHPHAGNDIIAPQGTPIRATFAGRAVASSNGLGGYAVYVYGDLGYTYNAHLVEWGYTGPVEAGTIIGHVGATGDTSTPHNHFEWHPYTTPTDWPASPYGYSVINSGSTPAVNPFPLLQPIC